ncbi:MAG: PAC2 family protein [Ilumatobacteraceae bacterium]
MEHVRWLSQPTLRNPIVITAFTGWNDAGDSASSGVRHLIEALGAAPLGEIDPEEFTDFATIRPHVRLSSGLTRSIIWPTVGMWHASTPGADVVMILGPEPAMRWRAFTEQIVGVAKHFSASMVVTLGALLADVPHSRTVQLIGTATDQDIIDRYDLQRSRYEGPTGIVGIIQEACQRGDITCVALWAAVPAYASQVPSPKATLALVERLGAIIGSPLPASRLAAQVEEYEAKVALIVADDDDLGSYVRRLESMSDAGIEDFSLDDDDDIDDIDDVDADDDDDDDVVGGELGASRAPTLPEHVDGPAFIDEVERFLRDQ